MYGSEKKKKGESEVVEDVQYMFDDMHLVKDGRRVKTKHTFDRYGNVEINT